MKLSPPLLLAHNAHRDGDSGGYDDATRRRQPRRQRNMSGKRLMDLETIRGRWTGPMGMRGSTDSDRLRLRLRAISSGDLSRSATLVGMRSNLMTASALFLAAVSQFASAQTPGSVTSRVAAQNVLFDDSWQATLRMNPLLATAVGDYRYNDQLGDYSLAASVARHRREVADLASIKAIDAAG